MTDLLRKWLCHSPHCGLECLGECDCGLDEALCQIPQLEYGIFLQPEVIKHLNEEIKAAGSLRNFADKCGVSASYVSDVVHGNRNPSGDLLETLGFSVQVWHLRLYKKLPPHGKVKTRNRINRG